MVNKYYSRIVLPFLALMATVILVSSCKKDNEITDSGKVQLLSFGPTGAMHGDTLVFIGRNLNKVTEIDLTSAMVPKANFISQTNEVIKIIVPQSTEPGFVTLKALDGDVTSITKLNLEVMVTVSSFPTSAKPGDKITLKGNYMNWIWTVTFGKDKVVDSFVSKSLTELVVTVPMDAQSGTLFITYGGTEPMTFETVNSLNVVLPAITSISPNPAEREKNITITGTNLDLVHGVWFKGLAYLDTVFVSKSATQIVLNVPATVNKGKVTLEAYSGLKVESAESLLFVGDLPDLEPLAYAMYIDGLKSPWQNWGWGSTVDFGNTENVRDGSASIKVNYTGQWSALKFANGSVSTAAYSQIAFSVFGTPGTNGKKLNVTPNGGSTYTITIEEGKWVEYKLTKAQLGNPALIKELVFQNQDWTGVIYMDQVGLR
ncbi:MAG: IPT/TIG domain-containing protein [Ginsengibacter sp.]